MIYTAVGVKDNFWNDTMTLKQVSLLEGCNVAVSVWSDTYNLGLNIKIFDVKAIQGSKKRCLQGK